MTAFELCGIYNNELFKLKNGWAIWENISYRNNCNKCRIERLCHSDEGGKSFFLGMNYKQSYIDPDTEIKILTVLKTNKSINIGDTIRYSIDGEAIRGKVIQHLPIWGKQGKDIQRPSTILNSYVIEWDDPFITFKEIHT